MNPPPHSTTPTRSSSGGCWLYSGIVLVIFLLVFMTASVITYVMPKKYESTAVIQVRPSTQRARPISPQDLATEFEVIRASLTLKLVVQRLNLTTEWNMTEEDAIAELRAIVSTQNIRGTDLVEIKVKHMDRVMTRDIAKEVYLSYKKRREDKERELAEDSHKQMEKAIVDHEDVVEEKRKQRDNIAGRSNGNANDPTLLDIQRELDAQTSLLEKMREKLAMEQSNAKTNSIIELHEEPVPPQYPTSPNVNFNLIIGAAVGLLLGLLMALFVRLVFRRKISV